MVSYMWAHLAQQFFFFYARLQIKQSARSVRPHIHIHMACEFSSAPMNDAEMKVESRFAMKQQQRQRQQGESASRAMFISDKHSSDKGGEDVSKDPLQTQQTA